MSDLMMQAVKDKIVAVSLKPRAIELSESNLVLPDTAVKPQLYSFVLSVGEKVKEIRPEDVIVSHPQAGMLVILDEYLGKVLKEDEVYAVIKNEFVKKEDWQEFSPTKEESKIVSVKNKIIT